jgi:uncharacterized membrane protein HdeD (DUF308 family)
LVSVEPQQRLTYRRVAVSSGLLGVAALIVGIIFYSTRHPSRGLVLVIVGALLLILGVGLAVYERWDRMH